MPGVTTRRVEVQILRSVPELWLAPAPGAPVEKAIGSQRESALFVDQMEQPLAVGVDQAGEPVYADFAFLNGAKGGHISISGISGVATKTSYALFLLYMLFETEQDCVCWAGAGSRSCWPSSRTCTARRRAARRPIHWHWCWNGPAIEHGQRRARAARRA